MDFLGLAGRRIVVFGLANRKSVACAVGRVLVEAGAEVVQVVGRKVTLYRKNLEKTIIDLR